MRPLAQRLQTIGIATLDALFPPACSGCGRRGLWVCEWCRPTVQQLIGLGCARCGELALSKCICDTLPPQMCSIRSAYAFEGWVREAIHSFKYEGERARAGHLGDLLTPLMPDRCRIDIIVPVPLHRRRLRDRGYNQSLLLAKQLSVRYGELPIVEIERSRPTTPQVDLPSRDRRANVAGAFAVPIPSLIAGRRVVLVDDVVTTASTMAACAGALAAAGAASVAAVSVARVV